MLAAGLPFLLLPVLTHYMSPTEFGLVGIFQGLYTIFLAICGLGMTGAIVRQAYDVNSEDIAVYIFNALLILLVTTSSLSVILWLSSEFLSDQLEIPADYFSYALIAAAMVITLNILLGLFQVAQKPLNYGTFQVGHSILNVSLSLVGVIVLSANALGRIGGIVSAAIIFGILALITLRLTKRIICQTNVNYIRSILRFGVPLIPHELGVFTISWFSLFVLNIMLDKSLVGVYLLAFQVSMVLGVICDAFNRAYVPWLFSILKSRRPEDQVRPIKLTYIYFILLVAIVVLSFLLSPWLVALVFDEKYAEASWMVGWLVLGQALGGAYLMVTNYIIYVRRTEILSMITLTGGIVNVVSLFALVPIFGVTGAIAAYIMTWGVILVMTWYFAHRLVPMPWKSW